MNSREPRRSVARKTGRLPGRIGFSPWLTAGPVASIAREDTSMNAEAATIAPPWPSLAVIVLLSGDAKVP